ncbi:MAG: hypothetical protein HQM10_05820 [Candidatus Riflebacteria bacterium]|nr:hypothetical protein [Candidatus Riflebacteria bacterium]
MASLLAFWKQVPEDMKLILFDFLILVIAFVSGKLVSIFSTSKLTELGINEHFNSPFDFSKVEDKNQKGASDYIGILLSGTVWFLAASWIANVHKNKNIAGMLFETLGRVWTVAILAGLAFFCGNLLAKNIMGIFRNAFFIEKIESMFKNQDFRGESFADTIAKAIGSIIFCFTFLLVFLSFAETFNMKMTLSAVSSVWSLGINLFTSIIAISIGWAAINYISNSEEFSSTDLNKKPSMNYQARIGIVLVTTLFALDMVASAAGTLLWVGMLLVLGVLIVPAKRYLFDIWAGFSLEFYQIKNVTIEGRLFYIETIRLLETDLRDSGGEIQTHPNHFILAAHFQEKRCSPA